MFHGHRKAPEMRYRSIPYLATMLLLAATLGLSLWSEHRVGQDLHIPLTGIPSTIDGWQQTETIDLTKQSLDKLKPSDVLSRVYTKDGWEAEVFVAYYASQHAGETMHSPKQCLVGSGWEIWKPGSAQVSFQGKPVTVNRYGIQRETDRMIVFYWYQSQSRIVASEYAGKLLLARDALLKGNTAGSLVRIALKDRPGADQEGLRLAGALMPLLQPYFSN